MTSITTSSSDTYRTVGALLGGRTLLRSTPRSPLDWIDVVRRGIPAGAIELLAKAIKISQLELARALNIPERTLARRKREGTLNSEESAKLLRLARAVGRANEIFESPDAARHWLKSPNSALAGFTPLSMLDTEIGAESVLDTLGRIEHGVYA
jgi:putative toxin-antitoxin system antitoxin component (TIGR02293 family)